MTVVSALWFSGVSTHFNIQLGNLLEKYCKLSSALIIYYPGSDLTAPDFLGTSPFHLAIAESAISCLSHCLRFLPREILEIPDAQLRSPLIHAVSTGNLESVQVGSPHITLLSHPHIHTQLLLAADADPNTVQDGTGTTALHVAAQLGHGLIIELLLSNGAAPDIVDTNGHTPVHLAAVWESVDSGLGAFVRVVGGSVLDLRDAQGLTPIMHSAAYASTHNVKFLLHKKVHTHTHTHTHVHYIATPSESQEQGEAMHQAI